jgi:electron transfer flavoprotein alpha subunit
MTQFSPHTLILAEAQETSSTTLRKVLTAASQLSPEGIDLVIVGDEEMARSASTLPLVHTLFYGSGLGNTPLSEDITTLVLDILNKGSYTHIISAASTLGKSVLPRVAALKDVMQISEVMEILDPETFVRPIYAGNALMTVKSSDELKVMTIRTASFKPFEGERSGEKASFHKVEDVIFPRQTQFISLEGYSLNVQN